MENYRKTLTELEELLRRGREAAARDGLVRLARGPLPRGLLAPATSLARRSGAFELAGKLSRPIARDLGTASYEERAEYAALKIASGAADEAVEILDTVDFAKCPEAHLYLAYALFQRWEFDAASSHLTTYVSSPSLAEHEKLLGEISLCRALVHGGRVSPAGDMLPAVIEKAVRLRDSRLEAQAREVCAHRSMLEQNWSCATRSLNRASAILGGRAGTHRFHVGKWKAVLALMKEGPTASALAAVETSKREAMARRQWEAVRQLDLILATRAHDIALARHLHFGTRHPAFRNQLASFAGLLSGDEPYAYRIGPQGPLGGSLLLSAGRSSAEYPELKAGKLLHRLLSVLTADFYRPFALSTLFSALYPGEYYNAMASPLRLHQLMHRLRRWTELHRLPLRIEERRGLYRLGASAPFQIVIHRASPVAASQGSEAA